MHYVSQVWARAHASKLAQCQSLTLSLITGATAKFHQFPFEILCGIPPIDVQIELNTIKFLIKTENRPGSLAMLIRRSKTPASL